jgi:predicted membrane-bound spermidine synthase
MKTRIWLRIVFFLSGIAALVYQVVWQRSLYALFGINIESVTLVVSAFLAGLGLGSYIGGVLSRRANLLGWFAFAELSVGIYGFFSLELFQWVSARVITAPETVIGVTIIGLLIIPTVMMGMTLPLLVSDEVRRVPRTARAVGLLYFINTAGSAVAAAFAVLVLLPLYGEHNSVAFAAALNIIAGSTAAVQSAIRSR